MNFNKTVFNKVKFLVIALSSVLTLGSFSNVQAQTTSLPNEVTSSNTGNCISAQDMTAIAQKFRQYQSLAGREYCFDGSQTSYVLGGVHFIQKIQFNNPQVNSPDELFTGRFANDWFGYFTTRIKTIKIETNCPQGAAAFVIGFFHRNTMHVCPSALTPAFSALDLASIFMHEARHIDGYGHITCSQGPRANLRGACDNKISDGGSYAVSVETYAQLGQYGKDIHPASRAIAEASAMIYAAEAFQTPVRMNTTEEFIALTSDKKLYTIDSSLTQAPVMSGETTELGKILKSRLSLLILPTDKTKPLSRVFPSGETITIDGEYNEGTPADRAQVVDYHLAWTWNARIEKNKVRFFCDKREKPTQSNDVALPSEALGLMYTTGYKPDQATTLLNTRSGLVQIGCVNGRGQISQASANIASDIKSIHKANNTLIGFTQSGEILNLSANSARIDLGIGPIYDISSYTKATFFDQ